jgi:hypothetical protein
MKRKTSFPFAFRSLIRIFAAQKRETYGYDAKKTTYYTVFCAISIIGWSATLLQCKEL